MEKPFLLYQIKPIKSVLDNCSVTVALPVTDFGDQILDLTQIPLVDFCGRVRGPTHPLPGSTPTNMHQSDTFVLNVFELYNSSKVCGDG